MVIAMVMTIRIIVAYAAASRVRLCILRRGHRSLRATGLIKRFYSLFRSAIDWHAPAHASQSVGWRNYCCGSSGLPDRKGSILIGSAAGSVGTFGPCFLHLN